MIKNGLSQQSFRVVLSIFIGLAQGTSFYFLDKIDLQPHWLSNYLHAFTIAFGLLLLLGLPIAYWRRWMVGSLVGGGLIAVLYSYWFLNVSLLNNLFYFNALNLLATYVIIVYSLSLQEEKLRNINYHLLFKYTWNSLFFLLISATLTLLIWLLISFWGYVFELVGFVSVNQLLDTKAFKVIATFIIFAFSCGVSKQYLAAILRIRKLFFKLCFICLPILGIITLSFLLILLLNHDYWEFSTGFLFAFTFFAMVVNNAVIQEGNRESPYPFWLQYVIETYFIALPIIPFLMMMTLSFRMNIFGLRPWLMIKFGIAVLMEICLLGYAFASFLRSRGWMWAVPRVNMTMSLVIVFVVIGLQLPFLNPFKLSIANQVSRLLSGQYIPTDNEPTYLPSANLSGLNLHGIFFHRAHLQEAKFSAANLSMANLSFADMRNTDLSKANLSGANLIGAKLAGANLTGANLKDAVVSGIDFMEVKGLTQKQLDQVGCSRFVVVPKEMHIRTCKLKF